MKLIPRDYQAEARNSIFQFFERESEGNPLVAMPTGTGKSIVIADFLEHVFKWYGNQKILVLTHVKELIEQNYDKLIALWPEAPAGIYSAGLNKRDVHNRIIFAGIGSVVKRAVEFGHVDLIMIDEAHLVSPNQNTMYQKFISALFEINPLIRIIGLTATPWRLGQGEIIDGGLFTHVCFDITGMEAFNRLIAEGYLATLIPKPTVTTLEVDGVHMRGGEFIQKELQTAVDVDAITEAAIRESMEVGHDRNCWLVFASGVEHVIHVTEMLNQLGVSARAVHGGNKQYPMRGKERDKNIEDFKAGKYTALVNNNVLTTGFDHPPIDMIIMLRPTASPVLWVQMLGRGTRPWYAEGFDLTTIGGRLSAIENGGKKNCLVLDFGGNSKRLGPINDPVIPRKKGKKKGTAPVKLCDPCNTFIHASLKFCPHCGNEFKFETKLKQSAGTNELIKGDIPIIEEFKIDHITYSLHRKAGASPMIKVAYFAGLRKFNEFVCIEHSSAARRRAQRWWKERTDFPFPDTSEEALLIIDKVNVATSVRVWINKKYPEILAYCFDGTHFMKEQHDPNSLPKISKDMPLTIPKNKDLKQFTEDTLDMDILNELSF